MTKLTLSSPVPTFVALYAHTKSIPLYTQVRRDLVQGVYVLVPTYCIVHANQIQIRSHMTIELCYYHNQPKYALENWTLCGVDYDQFMR